MRCGAGHRGGTALKPAASLERVREKWVQSLWMGGKGEAFWGSCPCGPVCPQLCASHPRFPYTYRCSHVRREVGPGQRPSQPSPPLPSCAQGRVAPASSDVDQGTSSGGLTLLSYMRGHPNKYPGPGPGLRLPTCPLISATSQKCKTSRGGGGRLPAPSIVGQKLNLGARKGCHIFPVLHPHSQQRAVETTASGRPPRRPVKSQGPRTSIVKGRGL